MEGRQPPPPARHLFPDDPTPINKKFWGTQSMRGFLAFGVTIAGGWLSLVVFNAYLMRNEDRVLFFKLDFNPDNFQRRVSILRDGSYWHRMISGFQTTKNQIFPDKNQPPGYDLGLDDSVRQNMPSKGTVNNLRIR